MCVVYSSRVTKRLNVMADMMHGFEAETIVLHYFLYSDRGALVRFMLFYFQTSLVAAVVCIGRLK